MTQSPENTNPFVIPEFTDPRYSQERILSDNAMKFAFINKLLYLRLISENDSDYTALSQSSRDEFGIPYITKGENEVMDDRYIAHALDKWQFKLNVIGFNKVFGEMLSDESLIDGTQVLSVPVADTFGGGGLPIYEGPMPDFLDKVEYRKPSRPERKIVPVMVVYDDINVTLGHHTMPDERQNNAFRITVQTGLRDASSAINLGL